MDCRDELDALEALGLQIDRELLSLAIMQQDPEPNLRKVSSAPDLRDLNVTISDMELSGMCTVNDLSHDPLGVVAEGERPSDKLYLGDSKEWLDTFL